MSSNHPPVVVVDTTAFRSDLALSTSAWLRTKLLAAKGRLQLWVPEVVVREAARHYERQVRLHLAKLTDAGDALLRLTWAHDVSQPPNTKAWDQHVDVLTDGYQEWLRGRLRDAGAVILPLPQMSHEEMLDRALREDRPFRVKGDKDKSGHDRYRDMLIWASVAERSRNDLSAASTLILVTNNAADFCDPQDPATVARAMRDDLGGDAPAVQRLPRLEDLAGILPSSPEEGPELNVQKSLRSNRDAWRQLAQFVVSEADRLVDLAISSGYSYSEYEDEGGLDFDAFQLPLESPRVTEIFVFLDTIQAEVYGTDTDWDPPMIFARVTARGEVSVEGYMPIFEFDASLGFSARQVNDHVYHSEGTVRAELQFGARFDLDGTLADISFEKANPVPGATLASRVVLADHLPEPDPALQLPTQPLSLVPEFAHDSGFAAGSRR